ncbi:MAG: hypothetical protein D6689_11505, partial [Deltaproteobacteria bacterium]
GIGGGGCATIACPTPDGGKVSLCGQLYDVQTGMMIRDPDADGSPCESPTADGPCSLSVQVYDPLAFAGNPTATPPLPADFISVDNCGHFVAKNVMVSFSGFMAIAVDDAGATDARRLTGIAFPVQVGEARKGLRAFSLASSTDQMWTTTAGEPFGSDKTFVDKGVYGVVFFHPDAATGAPVEGVTVTAGGTTRPDDDFYFSDTAPLSRSTVDPALDRTGPNGMALMVNISGLPFLSGVGGDIGDNCEWQSESAASIAGVLFFRESFTHAAGDLSMACQ